MKAPLNESARKLLSNAEGAKKLMTAIILKSFEQPTQEFTFEGKKYKLEKLK